jgi:cobalamin-dependent methionine synthase I
MTPDVLELEGCPEFRGPIASFLRPARRVAVFVATVGGGIEQAADRCYLDGQAAESFVLHAIGSAAAEAACDAMIEYLWAHEINGDEAVTAPFSPGYCGLPLTEQQTLFSILDTREIGVDLLPSMMMRPIKSVSGLAGIGPVGEVEAHGVPCEHCQIDHCRMRRPAK